MNDSPARESEAQMVAFALVEAYGVPESHEALLALLALAYAHGANVGVAEAAAIANRA